MNKMLLLGGVLSAVGLAGCGGGSDGSSGDGTGHFRLMASLEAGTISFGTLRGCP